MESYPSPFSVALDPTMISSFETGKVIERRLSHLKDYYVDQNAVGKILTEKDRLIYKVWELEYEGTGRGISMGMTIIYPGQVGSEYHMTRGHFHAADDGDELYIIIRGKGGLLMFDRIGNSQFMELHPGNLYYVPGHLAHRTINTGTEDLVFLSIWPPHIQHDYATITKSGFPKMVVSSETGAKAVENPNFSI